MRGILAEMLAVALLLILPIIAIVTRAEPVEDGENCVMPLSQGGKLEMIWIKPGTFTTGSPNNELGADEVISEEKLIKKVCDSLVPPGTIISFGGENVPDGWLECDGRPLSSKDYPALYQAIGQSWGSGITLKNGEQVQSQDYDFNLPELHGVFLRGWNSYMKDTRKNDPDADGRYAPFLGGSIGNHVGSYQSDVFGAHVHSFEDYTFSENSGKGWQMYGAGKSDWDNAP